MSESSAEKSIPVSLHVRFDGARDEDSPPPVTAHAFDVTGGLIASAPVEEGRATLDLPERFANQTVRFFVGPATSRHARPTISSLGRKNAYEIRQRIDLERPVIQVAVHDPIWRRWIFCPCYVSGQVVTNVSLPSGVTKQLPICNARVNICEVWELPIIFHRLPDDILWRLREEVVRMVAHPVPPIPPGPELGSPGFRTALALATAPATAAAIPALRPPSSSAPPRARLDAYVAALGAAETAAPASAMSHQVRALALSTTAEDIRARLIDLGPSLIHYFCFWDWLEPWLVVDCFETVVTDDNGRFFATVWYPCDGPAPNLYFSAEQLQNGHWVSIYEPWVRCATHWNYPCGSSVTLTVTDPAAMACAPQDPVNPPPGADDWVLVTAVGGTYVWGTEPPAPAPVGWVRQDGLTDYGGVVDAPFGGYLGFRSGASISIPNPGATYYRWSYRRLGTTPWFQMSDTVVRHYVKETPPHLPTFPVQVMGPRTVGGVSSLYLFKPLNPPGPAAGDPTGTITYWPNDDLFADIYSGYLDTTALPGGAATAAGVYQIKLEVFDSAANPVDPGAGTFRFIVPSAIEADGSVDAREADPSELDVDGGYIFNLHIDNNPCVATLAAATISGGGTADDCGFLNYASAADPISLAFQAQHPNGFATFRLWTVRGAVDVAVADASGEVWAASAGSFTGDGDGDFTSSGLTVGALLGSCVNGAFAEGLHVDAKATTGWSDGINAYDADALRAFALAEAT